MLCIAKAIFVLVGVGFSIFFGLCYRELWTSWTPEEIKAKGCAWRFWQFWQNFVGSAIGWIVAFYYVFYRGRSQEFPQVGDAVPILVALLGILGFLPWALSKVTFKAPNG